MIKQKFQQLVCLNCENFVSLNFVVGCFDFFFNTHFYNIFFRNCNGLSDDQVLSFTQIENDPWVYSLKSFIKFFKRN